MTDLDKLKATFKAWDATKGKSVDAWMALFADQVHIQSLPGPAKALAFANERKSRSDAAQYFSQLTDHWSMVHWSPHTYVTEGNRIAVFSTCGWTNKETGKLADTPIAHLFEFASGKVISVIEIFDSARVQAAATP